MDDVMCFEGFTSILDCWHLGWNVHDCEHSEDLGLKCAYIEDNLTG